MKSIYSSLLLGLILFSRLSLAQITATDPGWQWARFSNTFQVSSGGKMLTDAENNILTHFYYSDSVFIEDTAFIHYHPDEEYNLAIVKRNSDGEFIRAIDVTTNPDEFIFGTDLVTDQESNIYLYGSFSDTVRINDNLIVPERPGIELFLIKLNKNLEFQWSQIISSRYQDENEGIAVSGDNYLYLTSSHFNSMDTTHCMVNYFGQDSADVYAGLNSLLKIDPDGRIIWRAEIRDAWDGHTHFRNTVTGEDGFIYLAGYARSDIFIQGDTLKHPSSPNYDPVPFVIRFDQEGLDHHSFFIPYMNFGNFYPEFYADNNGNYIISTVITSTLEFGIDTIQVTNDSSFAMVVKLNPEFYPTWYRGIMAKGDAATSFRIRLVEDSIAFAFHGKGRFKFMGQEFVLNAVGQVFCGRFSPDGELVHFQETDAAVGASLNNISADQCGKLLIDGGLRGMAHFGNDTINPGFESLSFIAKSGYIQPFDIEFPSEVTACDTVTLYAPSGHDHYRWNGVDTDQHWFLVNTTGVVQLKITDNDCNWGEVESYVTVWPAINLNLGNDILIPLSGTLELSACQGYESYLWSTGDTTANLVIPADQLQIGGNMISLEIVNGPCYASDTILVTVVDDSFVKDISSQGIILRPNPAADHVVITGDPAIFPEQVIFYNLQGYKVLESNTGDKEFNISALKKGIYIVETTLPGGIIRQKLIII
jgi:hypothetical protein